MDAILNLDPMKYVAVIAVLIPLGVIGAATSFFVSTLRQALKADQVLKDEKASTAEKAFTEEKAPKDDKASGDVKAFKYGLGSNNASTSRNVQPFKYGLYTNKASISKDEATVEIEQTPVRNKTPVTRRQTTGSVDAVRALLTGMNDSELIDALSALAEELQTRRQGNDVTKTTVEGEQDPEEKNVETSTTEDKVSSVQAE